jgi:DNA-binding NtrC family response regulator
MANRILIVDDDGEFNKLLTDVFRQANYEVFAEQTPQSGLELLGRADFDLVVTDQRFPQGSGLQLLRDIRRTRPEIPVVIVSGFLDNDTIRDLIREGIRGVFMKPLNIFSLLKKTGELIEASKADRAAARGEIGSAGGHSGLTSFPGLAARSRDFATKLKDLANFRRNLVLIGAEGAPFAAVCADIMQHTVPNQTLVALGGENLTEVALRDALAQAVAGAGVTVAIHDAARLHHTATALLRAASAGEAPFDGLGQAVRFIFCLNRDVDSLYDEGRINEAFYLFLGTNELRIPDLGDVPEDIPSMAQSLLTRILPNTTLDPGARSFLCRHNWAGHCAELEGVLQRACRLSAPRAPTVPHIQAAMSKAGQQLEATQRGGDLQTWLLRQRAVFDMSMLRLTAPAGAATTPDCN